MQLPAVDKAICNPRKSTPERRERGKLSRIQGTSPPTRSLKQILRKSSINLIPRHGYRQGIISQALLGHCLALCIRGKSPSDTKTSGKSAWSDSIILHASLIHFISRLFTLIRKTIISLYHYARFLTYSKSNWYKVIIFLNIINIFRTLDHIY